MDQYIEKLKNRVLGELEFDWNFDDVRDGLAEGLTLAFDNITTEQLGDLYQKLVNCAAGCDDYNEYQVKLFNLWDMNQIPVYFDAGEWEIVQDGGELDGYDLGIMVTFGNKDEFEYMSMDGILHPEDYEYDENANGLLIDYAGSYYIRFSGVHDLLDKINFEIVDLWTKPQWIEIRK